jgi:hypothetical protein
MPLDLDQLTDNELVALESRVRQCGARAVRCIFAAIREYVDIARADGASATDIRDFIMGIVWDAVPFMQLGATERNAFILVTRAMIRQALEESSCRYLQRRL